MIRMFRLWEFRFNWNQTSNSKHIKQQQQNLTLFKPYPVSTRRRFNVVTTSYQQRRWRPNNVISTSKWRRVITGYGITKKYPFSFFFQVLHKTFFKHGLSKMAHFTSYIITRTRQIDLYGKFHINYQQVKQKTQQQCVYTAHFLDASKRYQLICL